jgi:isocitrate dehydrogenase kinase/phosphatase
MRTSNLQPTDSPENKIFEKADEAESLEKQKNRVKETEEKIKALTEELKTVIDDEAKAKLEKNIEQLKNIKERMIDRVDEKITKISENK